jgi:hypothetical protein
MTRLTSWDFPLEPANAFWQNCTWEDASWRNLCHVCWLTTQSTGTSVFVMIFKNMFRMTQHFFQRPLSQEIRHGFVCTSSPLNEKILYLHTWRRPSRFAQMSSAFWLCFMYFDGIFHHEFVPWYQIVNQHFYKDVLQHLQEVEMSRKMVRWWLGAASWCFPCSHQWYLAKNDMNMVPHSPYSPDLASSALFLFPRQWDYFGGVTML